jgi:heme-degrading monooxygenase HmoA
MFRVPGDQVGSVAKERARRRIIEESKETAPGFISGELMSSTNETGQMCVLCNWENEAFIGEHPGN